MTQPAPLRPIRARINTRSAAQYETDALAGRLRMALRAGALDLPVPGRGRTSERHNALYELGREDLSLARVAEAHVDAVSILAESGRQPVPGALYGVWASDGPEGQLLLEETPRGVLTLTGLKRYCTGSSFLDAALVTAHRGSELLLVELPLKVDGLRIDTSQWASPAFRATATGTVAFERVPIVLEQLIGGSGWYLDRPGFWHGAIGPASCWAGGAAALLDAARALRRKEPHYLAHLGALEANVWGMIAVLDRAGREIDSDPAEDACKARVRALSARQLIERACTEIMDHFGRATGPALLAFDAAIAQRFAELTLFIRQCHAERDLQALAQ